jgi:hypothetical protein
MQGWIDRADAGNQRIDQAARGRHGWRMPALLDEIASRAKAGWGQSDSLAETPANNRPTRQVGETHLGFTLEPLKQPMDIAGDDISAVAQIPRLVPGEERVERRVRWKGARVEASRQRCGRMRHGTMMATNFAEECLSSGVPFKQAG